MAAAVRQTEERVAEVRRRAEDAVNQVNDQIRKAHFSKLDKFLLIKTWIKVSSGLKQLLLLL
jgi:hypothetical protein